MKYCKKLIKVLNFIFIFVFVFSYGIDSYALPVKIVITDFESFEDIRLQYDDMGDYAAAESAEEELLNQYNTIKVNGNTGEVDVELWYLQSDRKSFDNKVLGIYTFYAILGYSSVYNTSAYTADQPSINIIIYDSEEAKTPITKYESLENILINTENTQGFSNINEAQESLLERYHSVKVNDSDDEVSIDSWTTADDNDYDSSKAGTYTFTAEIGTSDKYKTDEDSPLLTVNIIITEPEIFKETIYKFEILPTIYIKTTFDESYTDAAEAAETLQSTYQDIKVNGSGDTVPIEGWSYYGKFTKYDSAKVGYTFVASLGSSEKYNTENIDIDLPTVEIIFSLSKGTILISLADQDNNAVSDAVIMVLGDEATYYGETDEDGECIIDNVICGTYQLTALYNYATYKKTVKVKDEITSDVIWEISVKHETAFTDSTDFAIETTETAGETTAGSLKADDTSDDASLACIMSQIADESDEPVKIEETQTASGLNIEIYIDKTSNEKLTELKQMNSDDIAAELQKAVNAVSTINFIKTSDDARKEIADSAGGLNASILPINFTEHASFSFPVKVSVSVGEGVYPAGDGYFLYYYNDETGLLESYGSASVNEKGTVTFTISHCSDYFLMDKQITANSLVSNNDTAKDETQVQAKKSIQLISQAPETEYQGTVTISDKSAGKSPTKIIAYTKDKSSISGILIMGGLVFVIVCGLIICKKEYK